MSRQRQTNAAKWEPWALRLFVALALSAMFSAGYLYALGTSSQIEGILVALHRSESETGGEPVFLVRLPDGTTVRAAVGEAVSVRYGHRVLLSETRTRLFGARRYRFLRYAEPRQAHEGFSNQPPHPTASEGRFVWNEGLRSARRD